MPKFWIFLKSKYFIYTIFALLIFLPCLIYWLNQRESAPPRLKNSSNPHYMFKAENSRYSADIGRKDTKAPQVMLERDGKSITFTLKEADQSEVLRNYNEVIFTNVYENTDVKYTPLINGIKEEIILNKRTNTNEFEFDLKLQGLKFKKSLSGDSSHVLVDSDNNYQFHFEEPFAYDSKGIRTYASNIKVVESDKETKLFLTVDKKWLEDKSRAYPVYIDPTIVHDTSSEFASGTFNRVQDIGSGSNPRVETKYTSPQADSHTIGLWRFDETSENGCNDGDDACDSSGNNYNGVATIGTIETNNKISGSASRTFASGDSIDMGDIESVDTAQTLSGCAWVYHDNSTADHTIFAKNNSATDGMMFFRDDVAFISGRTDVYAIFFADGSDTDTVRIESVQNAGLENTWNHVCFTFEVAKTKGLRLFINGEEDPNSPVDTTTIGNINSTTNTFVVGNTSQFGTPFAGEIDEVILSSRVFSPEEIKILSQRYPYSIHTSDLLDTTTGVTQWDSFSWTELGVNTGDGETLFNTSNLVAQWNFNNTSGTTLTNNAGSCSTACNGSLNSFASTASQDQAVETGWTSINRKWGAGALMFDGLNDNVVVADTNNLSFGNAGTDTPFSISVWVYPYSISTTASTGNWIMAKRNADANDEYQFAFWQGQFQFYLFTSNGNNTGRSTNRYFQPMQWYNITATYDGSKSNSGIKIYVNGRLEPSTGGSNGTYSGMNNGTAPLVFGKPNWTTAHYFDGIIDAAAIYGRELSASEILSNYQSENLEIQTRVGNDNTPDDGTWEEWRPATGETNFLDFDNFAQNSNWADDPRSRASGEAVILNSTNVASSDSHTYVRAFNNSTVIATGDTLEYDIITNNGTLTSTSGVGGVDVRFSDTTYARASGWTDSNGNPCQIGAGSLTLFRWHKRVCTFTSTDNGKTISWIDLVNELDTNTAVWALYDNIVIKNSSGGIKSIIYTSGQSIVNTIDFRHNVSNTGTVTQTSSNNAYPIAGNNESVVNTQGSESFKFTNALEPILGSIGTWKMEETGGSGAYIKDTSPGGLHGTPTGTTVTNGISGKARTFNGSTDYITLSTEGSGLSTNTYSFSAWVKETATQNATSIIFDNRDSLSDGWMLYTGNGAPFICRYNGTDVNGTTYPIIGVWYHVACTSNGSTLTVYVNGVAENSGAISGSIAETTNAVIGGRSFTVPANTFTGIIDEVSIINRAISTEEVAEEVRLRANNVLHMAPTSTDISSAKMLYFDIASDRPGTYLQALVGDSRFVNQQTDPNTIGYWKFDEISGSGAYIKDYSWSARHGTPTGTTSVTGKFGKARSFLTTGNNISLGSQGMADSQANITVDAWIQPTAQTASTHFRVFTEEVVLYVGQFGNQISFYMGNGTSWIIQDTTGGTLPLNTWSHVAWVKSGTSYFIYLNGKLVKTGSGAPATLGTSSNINYISTFDGSSQFWTGNIDELRISNTVRSADDIRQAYEFGARAHQITIDFAAGLTNDDLISNSSDLSFEIDARIFGLNQQGSNLYKGDKIIVKENYDGTEYIAQSDVQTVNSSTGAITVSAWKSGSTFPSGGFTQNATVFKWQREYWDITKPFDSDINAIASLQIRMLDGAQGRTVYIDNLKIVDSYLTNPTSSTITSSEQGDRYIQYRAILTSNDKNTTSQLSQVSLGYTSNYPPPAPTRTSPANNATGVVQPISFTFSSTDSESDYIRYKIEICENIEMTIACIVGDQTSSQTGWSGQNAQSNSAYTSGSTATFTTSLKNGHKYFWRTQAIDPGGSNEWSSNQTPFNFTTNALTRPSSSSALQMYTAKRESEIPTTTFGWSNITGTSDSQTIASANGWIDSSNLIPGRKYLIIATGSHNTDSASGKSGLKVIHGSTTFENSESVDQTTQTNASYKTPYFWFTVWTAVENEDLEVQQYWNGTGTQARAEDISLLVIDAQDLIQNNYLKYSENTNYTDLTTSYQDLASLTFTPPSATDSWWIMGYNQASTNTGIGAKFENQLQINSTTYSNNLVSIVGSSLSPIIPTGTVQSLPNTSQTISLQSREVAIDQVVQSSGVFALNLTAFEDFSASSVTTGLSMSTPGSWVTQFTLNPLNSHNNSEWIVIAGGNVDDAGGRVIGRIQENVTSITDDMGGWNNGVGDKTPMVLLDYYQNLSSGTKTFKFDTQTTLSGTSGINYPWMVAFSREAIPNYTTMDLPANADPSEPSRPTFRVTATDPDSNNIQYKIQICTNFAMTTGCITHDQSASQAGWSGQNANGNTTYTSGTQATLVQTSDLSAGTTYYWRAYSKDPSGTNIFTDATSTPRSFTVTAAPTAPSDPWVEGASNPTGVTDLTPEFSAIYNDPEGDSSASYQIQVNTASNFAGTTMWDSGKQSLTVLNGARSADRSYAGTALGLTGTTYYWRIRFWDSNDTVGAWSATSQFTMHTVEKATSCYLVKSTNSTQLTLNWKDNSSLESGYRVQKRIDGGAWSTLIDKAANSTTHTDSSITFGHTYQYRVAPLNSSVVGEYCTTDIASVFQGSIKFEGVGLEGVQIH